jgi:hypothetical protein
MKKFETSRPATYSDLPSLTAKAAEQCRRLGELQWDDDAPTLVVPQIPIGLGGQIFHRVRGLLLALMLDRRVVFRSLEEAPYGQVFRPLHAPFVLPHTDDLPVYDFHSLQNPHVARFDYWQFLEDEAALRRVASFDPFGGAAGDLLSPYLEGMLLGQAELTEQRAAAVAAAARRLDVDQSTLGVHVRRGDKQVETPFVPISIINSAILKACEAHGFRKLFVASDSPAVVDLIRPPSGVELIYDSSETRYNNANHKYLLSHPEHAEQETSTAVKNIYLLGRCGAVIGQRNAHFAFLGAAQICFRNGGKDFGALIPGDIAAQQSLVTSAAHQIRQLPRRIAKWALPQLTLRKTK